MSTPPRPVIMTGKPNAHHLLNLLLFLVPMFGL